MASEAASVRWRVVRSLFEILYRNPPLYWLASTVPFAGQWRRWQRLVIPRLAGKRVLEIGCGPGNLLVDLVQAGFTCSAIDRSPQMIATAEARLRRHHLEGQVSLQQGVAQKLAFAEGSFDSVVSTFPAEYIFDPVTAGEISRVLTEDGKLIVVLGATLLPANILLLPLVALQSLVYGGAGSSSSNATASTTIIGPQVEGLLRRLQAAGLSTSVELVKGPFWQAVVCIGRKAI